MVKKNKKEESTFSLSQYTCLALNVTGLFSNLLTFYAIHYLYINPYAEQAFGGHFQVHILFIIYIYNVYDN